MNVLTVDSNKHLSLASDSRLFFDDYDQVGENNFAHYKLYCDASIVENDTSTLTATVYFYTTVVGGETTTKNPVEVTLTLEDEQYVSEEFTITSDIIWGVGQLNTAVEFTGESSQLGLTNSVAQRIYDVLSDSSEKVYPRIGVNTSLLSDLIEVQDTINEELSSL